MYLYPRLGVLEALRLAAQWGKKPVSEIGEMADKTLESAYVSYAATGGIRVPEAHLKALRDRLRTLATECGYPEVRSVERQQRFDTGASILLYEEMNALEGEALRDETWQFFTCALVPDIVCWRWRNPAMVVSEDRYLGGNRNALGRLWLRAAVFRDERLSDPWHVVRSLYEDNFTAILERSAFSRHRAACRELGRAFLLRRSLAEGLRVSSAVQTLLRQAMLRVTRHGAFVAFAGLTTDELRGLFGGILDETLRALEGSPEQENVLLDRQPQLAYPVATVPQDKTAAEVLQLDWNADALADAEAAAQEEMEGVPVPRDFLELEIDDRVDAVWRAVLGYGSAPLPEIVRRAAEGMRSRGEATYQRLHEGGKLYGAIEEAIERGRRMGRFDIPVRGHRRATCQKIEEVPAEVWAQELRRIALANGPLQETSAGHLLGSALRELVGIQVRMAVLETAARAHVDTAIAEGMLIRDSEGLRVPY